MDAHYCLFLRAAVPRVALDEQHPGDEVHGPAHIEVAQQVWQLRAEQSQGLRHCDLGE